MAFKAQPCDGRRSIALNPGSNLHGLSIRIQELPDDALEEFMELWAEAKSRGYAQVDRVGKANDKGRDVVGFLTDSKHEGPWHLYQCKRKTLRHTLGVSEASVELAKMFYHHLDGAYSTLPEQYFFVAPRGVAGTLQTLIYNPTRLRETLLSGWDQHCARAITKSNVVALTAKIEAAITGFDFAKVRALTASDLAKDEAAGPALTKLVGLTPGDAPRGVAPEGVQAEELEYLDQLRQVYAGESGTAFATVESVLCHDQHGMHLREQRTRFFEAAAFKRFHRDNTDPAALDAFQEDVYHGVIESYRATHDSLLHRVDAVMRHASTMTAALVDKVTRVPVRQGMCHHLANEGRMKWVP